MKQVLLALCLFTLAACSISNGENKGGGQPTGGTVQPDQSGQSTSANIDGSWQMQHVDGEFTFLMTMTFRNGNNVLFTNDCSTHGRTLRAQVSAPASYQNGRITIQSDAARTERINEAGFKMDCTATLTRGSMTYSLNGNSLVLRTEDGVEMVLTAVSGRP